MNIVFWIVTILLMVILWFLLAFIFKPVGKFISRIVSDTFDIINNKDENSNDEKEMEEKNDEE